MRKGILNHLLRLITVALMLMAVAVQRDGRLLGHDLSSADREEERTEKASAARQADGTVVVSTKELGKKIAGYGGPTPLTVTLTGGIVVDIKAENNNESPEFFGKAFGYLSGKWKGRKAADILADKPDGVTGATLSSNALNENMQLAMQQVIEASGSASPGKATWTIAKAAVLLVVAMGCVLPLFSGFKRYRTLWLCVNVVVLGLWGGTFLSHALIVNWLSNGTNLLAAMAAVLMLMAAFLYPFFGKKNYYCTWICPMGSLQELAGKVNKHHKWKLPAQATRRLTQFNELLWATLMLLMLTGVWSAWMDYELFTAFLFTAASPAVIAVAVLFVLLSVFIPRPYCRFVCPTGCLLRVTQCSQRPD